MTPLPPPTPLEDEDLRLDSSSTSTELFEFDDVVVDESARYFARALVEDHVERRALLRPLCAFLLRADQRALLQTHLPRIVRMADSCPLRDWKSAMAHLVEHAHSIGLQPPVPLSVSTFFQPQEITADTCDDLETRSLFREQFLDSGRLSYLNRLLALKPDYAAHLYTFQRLLMREPGPLAFDVRNYIAIMAAARHRCAYLIELHREEFLVRVPVCLFSIDFTASQRHSCIAVRNSWSAATPSGSKVSRLRLRSSRISPQSTQVRLIVANPPLKY
jgi:hypothetical protein